VVYSLLKHMSMYLSKVRNSDLISKVLIGIIILTFISNSGQAQFYPSYPQNTQGGYGNAGYPIGYPQTFPNQGYPQQQTNPDTAPQTNGARKVTITEGETESMTHEDSVAAVIEARELEDLDLVKLRRSIFGYKLFNLQTFDPNLAVNIATPQGYILGSNDQIVIDVYGYNQVHTEAIVNSEGYILVDKAGLINVGGSTIEEAKAIIKSKLNSLYGGLSSGATSLKVSLGDIRSIKVTITGEVIAPGTYTVSSLSSVMNALYRSGGPNELGTFRNVKLIRNNKEIAVLDLYDIILKGYSASNVLLHDQDVIQVPPYLNRVRMEGEAKRKGYFELKKDERLNDVISYAGGFTPNAYTHKFKIYRNTSREKEILTIPNEEIDSFTMFSGDSVFIEKVLPRYTNLVSIQGAVYREGEYSLNSTKTLKGLIESAEGIRDEALTGRVSIVRTNKDLNTENISVNYGDILKGKAEDIELQREDLVIVPSIYDLTEIATIRIQGAINNPDAAKGIEFAFIRNMTLEDILVRIGGLTEAASLSRVEIVRRKKNVNINKSDAEISEIIRLDVNKNLEVVSGQKNIILEPYDEIFVRRSPNYQEQTFVEIQGEVFYPSTYGIKSKEERVSDIIKRAGGLTLQSYIPGATLLRTVKLTDMEIKLRKTTLKDIAESDTQNQTIKVDDVDSTREESIGINLDKILANPGSLEDLILQDGDLIIIPKTLQTVRVQGEVLYPNTVKFLQSSTFKNYISGAGGFTRKSLKRKSYVLYPNGSVDRTRKFLVFNIYPKVEPGSEIIIPEKAQNGAEQLAGIASIFGTLSATLGTIFSIYGFIRLAK
jgi:protein involved in polysaccharide export with SLBB domain